MIKVEAVVKASTGGVGEYREEWENFGGDGGQTWLLRGSVGDQRWGVGGGRTLRDRWWVREFENLRENGGRWTFVHRTWNAPSPSSSVVLNLFYKIS